MNTQNVNVKTATQEPSERCGQNQKDYVILMAEGVKGTPYEDFDVCEFRSLKELMGFRRQFPEEMKNEYSYMLSEGTQKNGAHISVVGAVHCKKFIKLVQETGISI
ncbi:hypothetical protein [Pectobacterium brasiliense]|uniref:hypothetical protein n=1 Tax=Pectobacterium brasiliense TaxID=180957 RepID=UPI001968CF01|nr:hypothetical protein [Pectobacterium brasiliense]MBN3262973.1 hypothetical protein [Pectobacterium brasiliense]